MALVKICKLLILRSSDRHFRPILAPKSRFSATCEAVPGYEALRNPLRSSDFMSTPGVQPKIWA